MREKFEELTRAVDELKAAPPWLKMARAEKVQQLLGALLLVMIETIEEQGK